MAYFMVSLDSPDKNREFAQSEGAGFVLLSDLTGESAKRYEVTSFLRRVPRRHTFYIDASGIIREIDRDVDASSHGSAIAATLERLHFPTLSSEAKQ